METYMCYFIAFILSVMIPENGFFISLCYGFLGRFYIIFWLIRYQDVWYPWLKSLMA